MNIICGRIGHISNVIGRRADGRGVIERIGHINNVIGRSAGPVWKSDGDHEPHEFTEWIFSDLPSFSGLGREDRERCSSFLSAGGLGSA
jgi:hypothetical protein